MSGSIAAAGLINVRVSMEMDQDSGNCKIRPAVRYSNDGAGWDGSKELTPYRTTNGIDWGTTYIDLTTLAGTTPRAYIQFGVQAANESGQNIEMCSATLRIEREK